MEVELDLYADDLEQDFNQNKQDDFGGDGGVDLYDDVMVPPGSGTNNKGGGGTGNSSAEGGNNGRNSGGDNNDDHASSGDRNDPSETNGSGGGGSDGRGGGSMSGGYHHVGNNLAPNHMGRRHQLYIGNLTWWTTDQDISNAMSDIGINDFQEVKFFENRANGQSKGYCAVSLGSETSMRLCMDRLPKKLLHGQTPVVTLPTKQALNNFESQQKTRPNPPPTNPPRGPPQNMPGQGMHPGNMQGGPGGPPIYQQRMMNPNGPPPPQHMRGPPHMQGGPNMPPQGPPGHRQDDCIGGMGPGPNGQMQPRFQGSWNNGGPPRQNGPPRPQFQGMPNNMGGGGPPRGIRPDWNRPPMHGGNFQQGPPPGHPQGPPGHMQPRGPPPPQMMGGPPQGPPGGPQGPAPHVNPAFFNQGPGGPPHPNGPMGGPPQQNMAPHPPPPNHFAQGPAGPPRGQWPGAMGGVGKLPGAGGGGGFPGDQGMTPAAPQISEVEFEEIMARNRTVSSSAIARAVSDAAASEYSSAIETLVTAISLIKQSKVAQDERCKILISSLQDTLHGIETKSYSRRDRSRSRDRHRRTRRERSSSRYRERSRERERDRDRDRDREGRYYGESYRDGGTRTERSRSRERGGGSGGAGGGGGGGGVTSGGGTGSSASGNAASGNSEHYREENSGRSGRGGTRKSPEPLETLSDSKRSSYYEESSRYRDRRDRDHRDDHRSRH